MKYLYPSIIILLIFITNACVSKKVYLEEVARRGASENVRAAQKEEIATLNNRIDSLSQVIEGNLNQLALKENRIQQLLTSADSMEAQNKSLRAELNRIVTQSTDQLQQSDEALQLKAKELSRKEAIIADLEKRIKERDEYLKNILGSIESALRQYSSDDLTIEQRDGKIYVALSNNLLFDSGKTALNNAGKQALQRLASALKINPDIDIIVEGHTDSIPIRAGAIKDNWDLSVLRATSVVRILTEDYEIPAEQITPSGKGQTIPKASNATPAGRALNRRIEIIIEPKLNEVFDILQGSSGE